jgi:hypothetical protein
MIPNKVEIISKKNQAHKIMFAKIPTTNQPATTPHLLGVINGTWWHYNLKACYMGRFNTKLYYFQKC